MRYRARFVSILLAVGASALLPQAAPQQPPCPSGPLVLPPPGGPVAFTEEQEADLGDAISEHIQRSFAVVDDDTNEYLQGIGDRILKQLPPTALRFQFRLVNIPEVNAFAIPGGRVYVTRKLAALAQSEDELAGVLAHEIGHVITRQLGARLTREFKDTLKVTTFGDRADIFDKYHQLVDHPRQAAEDPRSEDEQYDADAVALAAAARAGYSPDAYVALWDRYTETAHKTGNFFTDFFGATKPEARRLRQMVRSIATVPAQCHAPATPTTAGTFVAWRSRVIENTRSTRAAGARGLLEQHSLEPALKAAILWLRFSPDGKYVLAQDEATITVLTRDPFQPVLQIEAEDAMAAQFTRDSQSLVFATHSLRVERWDLATRARTNVHELALTLRHDCVGGELSPDGRLIACLEQLDDASPGYFNVELTLFDVETAEPRFRKRRAYPYPAGDLLTLLRDRNTGGDAFRLTFSPDGRYFILGHPAGETVVDVGARAEVKLPSEIRSAFRASFTFVGADRVVTVDALRPDHSALLRFPSGETIQSLTLAGRVSAATRGDFLLVRPAQNWAVGIVDIAQNRVVSASNASALDVYDTFRVNEQPNGDLALYGADSQRPLAVAALPRALLGDMSGASLSPNLKWVSLTVPGRGGVWSLETGGRTVLVRGFTSSGVASDGTLYADFSRDRQIRDGKLVEVPRMLTRVTATSRQATEIAALDTTAARVHGRFLTVITPHREGRYDRQTTLTVEDIATKVKMWSRDFPDETPQQFADVIHGRLIFQWPIAADATRGALGANPRLKSMTDAAHLKGGDAFLEIQDLASGAVIGRMVVETGGDPRRIRAVVSEGDEAVLADNRNQVAAYSISTGRRLGSVFGRLAVLSLEAGLLCVQNEPGHVTCHDSQSLARISELTLPRQVRLAAFSEDGNRLVMMTSDQVVWVFDVPALQAGADSARESRRTLQ